MSRPLWKGPFVEESLLKKVLQQKAKSSPLTLKIWSRSSTICPEFVGMRSRLHNGREFLPLVISNEMVGCKFGEFVSTRVRYEFKKKKKKK